MYTVMEDVSVGFPPVFSVSLTVLPYYGYGYQFTIFFPGLPGGRPRPPRACTQAATGLRYKLNIMGWWVYSEYTHRTTHARALGGAHISIKVYV